MYFTKTYPGSTNVRCCRLLVLAAAAIGEPVVQYGPFVMNSVAEIEQAISDFQQGKLTDNKAAASITLAE